jgi:hypothetical protein
MRRQNQVLHTSERTTRVRATTAHISRDPGATFRDSLTKLRADGELDLSWASAAGAARFSFVSQFRSPIRKTDYSITPGFIKDNWLMPDQRCGLNGSMQNSLEIYLQESQELRMDLAQGSGASGQQPGRNQY